MGSAQLEFQALEPAGERDEQPRSSVLKQEVAERLAAHRQRRARLSPAAKADRRADAGRGEISSKKEKIAAAVAERYAQTQSYRAFLAEESSRATQQAVAAAEVAARNAEAVAAVQQELLAELEQWHAPREVAPLAFPAPSALAFAERVAELPSAATPQFASNPAQPAVAAPAGSTPQYAAASLTVRLYDAAITAPVPSVRPSALLTAPPPAELSAEDSRVINELDEEIAFRQAPVFEEYSIEPPVPLPANLLEFPRQLIAARKVRPRLAEGPLREDTPKSPQMRIFEVEPDQVSTAPTETEAAPAWATMRLDAQKITEPPAPVASPTLAPVTEFVVIEAAPISLRLMAALVDAGLIFGAFLGCVAGMVHVTGWLPAGIEAVGASAGTLIALYVGYHLLFFTFSDQTPGMIYARIGLCTMTDENPSRAAMRKRLLAQIVAALPLGLGLLWAVFDEEKLGWHDRISRMYQRSY
jgi:hypothetical protein